MSDFNETSPLHGLSFGQFRNIPSETKTLLLRMIAMCCEKSYRRGFQQGWDSQARGDKVCDLERWRFGVGLEVSVSPHDTYHDTSLQRLKTEIPLYQVGLQKMEECFLTARLVASHIAPLFPRHQKRVGIKKSVRFAVLRRDGFRCVYCGARPIDSELHIDHIHPRSLGGSDEIENLVTACQSCNLGKSNKHTGLEAEVAHGR